MSCSTCRNRSSIVLMSLVNRPMTRLLLRLPPWCGFRRANVRRGLRFRPWFSERRCFVCPVPHGNSDFDVALIPLVSQAKDPRISQATAPDTHYGNRQYFAIADDVLRAAGLAGSGLCGLSLPPRSPYRTHQRLEAIGAAPGAVRRDGVTDPRRAVFRNQHRDHPTDDRVPDA